MAFKWIKNRFLSGSKHAQDVDLSTLSPETRFYAIGDIHGRLDLLQTLLAALDEAVPLVFLGDYVDRGHYSAQVLRHLHHLSTGEDSRTICLMGNHEAMLLGFLDNPSEKQNIWMHNGGVQTLASFGLTDFRDLGPEALAEQLRLSMGDALLDWLRELPLNWTNGNITAVHAALDPSRSPEDQSDRVCLWGHPNFPTKNRKDGHWVVHGHTIVNEPHARGGVISIDTGAFATNQLTAADISKGAIRFISTGGDGIVRSVG